MITKKPVWKPAVFSLLALATIAPLMSTGATATEASESMKIKSVDRNNDSIVGYAGFNAFSIPTPGGEEEKEEEGGNETPQSNAKICLGQEPLKEITKDMQELSERNLDLYREGKADEMVPHPTGNWKIITETEFSIDGKTLTSVGFRKDGPDSPSNREDGWSVFTHIDSDNCSINTSLDGKLHAVGTAASKGVTNGQYSENWAQNGSWYRENSMPTQVFHYGKDRSSNIQKEVWNTSSMSRDLRVYERTFTQTGEVESLTFKIDYDTKITNRDNLPTEEAKQLWDHYMTGGY